MGSCNCFFAVFIFLLRPSDAEVDVFVNDTNDFDLFDDDDMHLICPPDIQFNIINRRHLAIILAANFVPYVWENFRALLCSGVDAYVMFDEIFSPNSSLRKYGFKSRSNRSTRSYSHRFLYVTNQALAKFGVSYMKRLPSVQYTSWDRAIVFLLSLSFYYVHQMQK